MILQKSDPQNASRTTKIVVPGFRTFAVSHFSYESPKIFCNFSSSEFAEHYKNRGPRGVVFEPFLLKTSGVLASTALGNDILRATQLQVECGASGRWSETGVSRAAPLWKCTISGHAAPGEFGGLQALVLHFRVVFAIFGREPFQRNAAPAWFGRFRMIAWVS